MRYSAWSESLRIELAYRHQTVFWVIVIVIDWTDEKWNAIVIDYIAKLIVIDKYFRD